MNKKQANIIIDLLKEKGVDFDDGLSDKEVEAVQDKFDIVFPPDLKLFLQTKLPISSSFVHWRYGINNETGKKEIEVRLDSPKEGILFDIHYNKFWLDNWQPKPLRFKEQKQIATTEIAKQPKLIPLYSHRYIPSKPNESGNPVFSVHQTDIIYYGFDLMDYFSNEFSIILPKPYKTTSKPRTIEFWTEMIHQ
jgi:hypothetical protein